jgi:hypothetical protein
LQPRPCFVEPSPLRPKIRAADQTRAMRLDVNPATAPANGAPYGTRSDLQKLIDWLIDGARSASGPAQMIRGRSASGWRRRACRCGASAFSSGPCIPISRPQFHLAARRRSRRWALRAISTCWIRRNISTARWRSCSRGTGGQIASTIPTANAFRFSMTCARKGVTDYIALPLMQATVRSCVELDHQAARRLHR